MTSGNYTDRVYNADDDSIKNMYLYPPSGLVIDLKEQARNVDAGRPLVSLVCDRDEYPDGGTPIVLPIIPMNVARNMVE
ncbi:uncharacterized protein N7477_006263 [Penicillium maclennaniae]|uniref:uncharacterized protein n=1 Tax=Penicillium maclennaniae TaxID=1343394 RepID=UPI00254042E0|nr:uncharacterized protein N7477_006263 [Penicillium maclennaniae]KAJ5667693.1 hypothetical protein N7477_006263 [Penicillium maclennaniae]